MIGFCLAGVLFLARGDGVLEVWDLLEATHRPTASVTIASAGLTSISALAGGSGSRSFVAVGEQSCFEVLMLISKDANLGSSICWSSQHPVSEVPPDWALAQIQDHGDSNVQGY